MMLNARGFVVHACALAALMTGLCSAGVQAASPAREGAVPLTELIASVARKTGKTFIADPRIQGEVVLIGLDPASVDYGGLLSALHAQGYAAVDMGDHVRVAPDATVRQFALPLITGDEVRPDFEFVNRVIRVKHVPAAQLVPILRPMLPQAGHLVALPCANSLVIVDTYANTRRIEKVLELLDVGEPYQPVCETPDAQSK